MLHRTLFAGIFFTAFFVCTTARAQTQGATVEKREAGRTAVNGAAPVRQGIIMRNGKMMEIQPKGYAPLLESKKFSNGATLSPGGHFTAASGQVTQLKDGDRIDLQGNFIPNPVVVQQTTTVSGDTTGLGTQLLQAQALQERLQLLESKRTLLEKKNELLQTTLKDKTKTLNLQKVDADLTQVKQQMAAEEKKKQ
ncbi:DUF6799 domain-containing protein [Rufibacter sp. LB8]|uniref:DUF6799 domain-containing protein n=1 Tax=Rufibacter sp. LB8 TaxID=2777781 RepID=UPI00178C3A20|nr:DUF6799 domain-containing protein [Rufibacter sp. LB8]